MSERRKVKKDISPALHVNGVSDLAMRKTSSKEPMAVSSSLHSIHVSPRTPKTLHDVEDAEDDVELSLLGEDERERAVQDLEDELLPPQSGGKRSISARDKRAMVLLCVLCELFNVCYCLQMV
jgi:hypothetical protein